MSWDERLFGWVWGTIRGWRSERVPAEVQARRVEVAPLVERLRLVASATAEHPVKIQIVDGIGGAAPGVLWLPPFLDFAPTQDANVLAYVIRVGLGATAMRSAVLPRDAMPSAERAAFTALVAPRVMNAFVTACPGGAGELASLLEYAREAGLIEGTSAHPLFGLFDGGIGVLGPTSADEVGSPPTGPEASMRRVERATRRDLGAAQDENPLVHSFEKLHTLEEYKGGRKQLDGADELDAHANALKELEISEVIRSNEAAHSLLRSGAMLESSAADVGESSDASGIPYDEWDFRSGVFRPGWCRVKVSRAEHHTGPAASPEIASFAAGTAREVADVRNTMLRLRMRSRPRHRELLGAEVDDDAMVCRFAALAAGVTPPARLYVARRRSQPELAVLLLLDASLSTDGWVDGRRVLDVEQRAAWVIAEATEGWLDEVCIATFSSQTRRDCRFDVVKALNEPWVEARRRLLRVAPAGYTRIGPALRHARTELSVSRGRRRLLLVLTDGKPNDFDRYEGSYGVADVRHAVLEARAAGIMVHALAIDPSARSNLPRMFGAGGFTLLKDPQALAGALGEVIARFER